MFSFFSNDENQEKNTITILFYIVFLTEFSRILLGSYFTNNSEYQEYQKEKNNLTLQLSKIKSIQVEFVKHSLLNRKLIKIEKEITNLKENQSKQLSYLKYWFIIFRFIVYGGACFLYGSIPVAACNKQLFPILSYFIAPVGSILFLRGWLLLVLLALSIRLVLRTFIVVIPSWRNQLY